MNASELKDKLDMYISHGHENDEVIIHCREASVNNPRLKPQAWSKAQD